MLQRNVFTRTILVQDTPIEVDTEGYLINLDDWSEEFACALAKEEGLELTEEHWAAPAHPAPAALAHPCASQVIRLLCGGPHDVQGRTNPAPFARRPTGMSGGRATQGAVAGMRDGRAGKQGNRLAGLLKTKGEH